MLKLIHGVFMVMVVDTMVDIMVDIEDMD